MAAQHAADRPERTPASRRAAAVHRPRRAAADRVRHQHRKGQLPDLELRHRRRARCEDRIRAAKDTGPRNLPFHSFDANRIWLELVTLALDLTAWMQTLSFEDDPTARRRKPKTLRLRLFSIPARLARHARRVHLRLSAHNPWITVAVDAFTRRAVP